MQLRVAVSSRGLLLPVCVRVCLASHRASPRLSLRNWAKRGANIPEDLVMEASWEAVPRERGETAGCAFDVRFFDDPDAGSLRSHCGTHPEIMERFVLNQHFKALLLAVKRRLHAIAQQGHDTVRLIFYCNKGKHRSVAAGTLFGRCMDADGVCLRRGGHYHITPLAEVCACRLCHACRDGPQSQQGAEALNCAARMWRVAT